MQRITVNEFTTKQNPPVQISETHKQQHQTVSKPLPIRQLTSLDRATNWIDKITESLYGQISSGLQRISKIKPIVTVQIASQQNKRSAILQKPVDMDEHLKLVKKFMRMNKNTMKTIKQRSMQITQIPFKQKEEQQKKDKEEQMKALQLRRQQINERIQRKEEIMRKIRYQSLQSNRTLQAVKKKKFLYQQKQQAYRIHYLKPKQQEQRRLLKNMGEQFKPMDINKLLQHQKQYQRKRMNDRINRSLTSRVLQSQNHYEPPKFVPKSFLILSAEEEFKNQERKMKEQEHEMNEYRKKQFLNAMQEKQRQQFQRIKQKLQQAKSGRDNSVQEDKRKKEKSEYKRDREQIKNLGNTYMKELIELNKKRKRKQSKLTEMSPSEQSNKTKRNTKSQYQIELIKEERIESVQKIRFRKVDGILNNQRLEPHLKLQRLKYQQEKLGQMVSAYESLNGKVQTDEVASLYLSSIHTKLAILQVFSPKNNA